MKTQLSGGLEPTKYNGRAKDARPSKGIAWRGWESLARVGKRYNSLKKQVQPDKAEGNPVNRNQGTSPDGEQKTVKTETRFFKSNKER